MKKFFFIKVVGPQGATALKNELFNRYSSKILQTAFYDCLHTQDKIFLRDIL